MNNKQNNLFSIIKKRQSKNSFIDFYNKQQSNLTCPICNKNISSNITLLNLHIDFCLNESPKSINNKVDNKNKLEEQPIKKQKLNSTTISDLDSKTESNSLELQFGEPIIMENNKEFQVLSNSEKSPNIKKLSSKNNTNIINMNRNLPEPIISEIPLEESQIFKGQINGHFLIKNFITEQEEKDIINFIDQDVENPFVFSSFNGFCNSKIYGSRIKFGSRLNGTNNSNGYDNFTNKLNEVRQVVKPDINNGEKDLPFFMMRLTNRLKNLMKKNNINLKELSSFIPNECNVNEYLQDSKHYLRPHFDDRFLSGPILINLSLLGSCYMSYYNQKYFSQNNGIDAIKNNNNLNKESDICTNLSLINQDQLNFIQTKDSNIMKTFLSPRSLQIVSQDSRWYHQHAILKEDVLSPRRLSLTIRMAGGKFGVQTNNNNKISEMFIKEKEKEKEED